MAESLWWRGSGSSKGGPLALPQRNRASTTDDQPSWRNDGTSSGTRCPPPPGLASNWRPKLERIPLAPAPRFTVPQQSGSQQASRNFQNARFKPRVGGQQVPALFLQAHEGDITKAIFPSESTVNSAGSAVSSATIKVRPVATYTEAHGKGDKPIFQPWRQEAGRHPTPLAYNFTDSFPSAHGVRRTTLPDSKHFSYADTMYDPSVSVVEEALRVPGVRTNLTKYPPDVLGDGVGLLAGILKRSLGLPKAFPNHKRRSVVRLSPYETQRSSSKIDEPLVNSNSSKSEAAGKDPDQGPLRLFCDNPTCYLDDTFLGPRFEYICTQPNDEGDDDLERKGLRVQPYGGFRLILEVTVTPDIDASEQLTKDATSKLEPITILMCTEVDASVVCNPNKWVELKTCGRARNRTVFNRDSWCQAVLTGCQKAVTLFHKGDKIIDIEAFDVCATKSTQYVQNPKKHFGYMYNALKNMADLAKEPGQKYVVSEHACPPTCRWRKSSQ